MTDREKLIELLGGDMCKGCYCEDCEHENNEKSCIEHIKSRMADHLITNGVTVQRDKDINVPTKWISVKDERKPNHGDIALCYMTFGEYRLLQWDERSKLWVGDYMDFGFEDAAYWQMPQPPKGE